MQPGAEAGGEEMVVATPERVAFEYEIAGIGSRFLAQVIDLLLLGAVILAASIVAGAVGAFSADPRLAVLILILLVFVVVVGYFPLCEGIWSGQTVGKRALRIRVLGDRGEPVTATQVAIRNLVRIVDFLPWAYGIGLITIFIQGGGKRLGDFAAGTVVARERGRIRVKDLVAAAEARMAQAAPQDSASKHSIWADRQEPDAEPGTEAAPDGGAGMAVTPAVTPAAMGPYEIAVRRLDPEMRRFVSAYARRRNDLSAERLQRLADQVAPGLTRLLPTEVATYGAAAVLDGLAALVYTPPSPAAALPPSTVPPRSPLPPPTVPPAVE